MSQALQLIRANWSTPTVWQKFAEEYKSLPTLAYTHFRGCTAYYCRKRATLWLNDLVMDLEDLDYVLNSLRLFRIKGDNWHAGLFLRTL